MRRAALVALTMIGCTRAPPEAIPQPPTPPAPTGPETPDEDTGTEPGTSPSGFCAGDAALVLSSGEYWGVGHEVALADITGDGALDLLLGVPDFPDPWVPKGQVLVHTSNARGTRVLAESEWEQRWTLPGVMISRIGFTLTTGTLDGEQRVLVGGISHKPSQPEAHNGRAWLLEPPLPPGLTHLDATALTYADGEPLDSLGQALGLHGDLTGDGVANWSAGGPRFTAVPEPGIVSIFSGADRGPMHRTTDAAATIRGAAPGDLFGGTAILEVDQDGDGVPELVVAAAMRHHPETGSHGSVHWFRTPLVGDLTADDAFAERKGTTPETLLGLALDAGDLDGDGYPEVVIAAPTDHSDGWRAGRVYLVHGPDPGSGPIDQGTSYIRGEKDADQLGFRIKVLGDIDGDGTDDLVVTILHNNYFQHEPGEVLVFLGPLNGVMDPSDAWLRWSSGCPSDSAGYAIDAGDVDGDGRIDLLVGAPDSYIEAGARGAAYLLLGADLGFPAL